MEFIELKNGPIVRADSVRLYLDLEARGHVLTVQDNALRVSNGSALTAEDRAQITALKPFLIVLVTYTPPEDTV